MRAKDYARKYRADPTSETLIAIGSDFIQDTGRIIEARRCKTDRAVLAVFSEQNQKWIAFSRLIEGIRPDGYARVIQSEYPDIFPLWQAAHGEQLIKTKSIPLFDTDQ
jgi:hypothetical protein